MNAPKPTSVPLRHLSPETREECRKVAEAAKHTPGPWAVGMRTGYNANTVFARDGEKVVALEAQFWDTSICSVYGIACHRSVSEVMEDGREQVGLANARLIAAAPDILEALKLLLNGAEVVQSSPRQPQINGGIILARAAIAKAEGRAT